MRALPDKAGEPATATDPLPSTAEAPDTEAGAVPATAGDEQDAPPRHDAGRMRRKQVRGSALLVVGRVLTMVITTATQVVVVRALTKGEFGGFSYALSLATAGQTLLSLGQGRLLSRFMAKYEEQRDYDRMFGAMVLAVGTIVATSTLLVAAMFVMQGGLIPVEDPSTVHVVLILIFLAPLQALDQVFVSLFAVFSAPRAIFFRKYLFTPGLRLAVVVALALTHASVMFLALGYVLTGVVGFIVQAVVFLQVLRERGLVSKLRPSRIRLPFRAVFSFSMPLISGEFLLMSFTVGGVIVLGYFHPAAEVASYRAVFNPARLNTAVLAAFVPMFLPLAARLFERGDVRGLREAYWHTGALVAVLTFPIFALTGPLAPSLAVVLFGHRYASSGLVLSLLSLGYYFSTAMGFNTYTLQVTERIRFLLFANIGLAGLNVGLCILLGRPYGAAGVAAANLAVLVSQNVIQQWVLRRAIGTAFIDRSCVRCYAAIAGVTAVLAAFQYLLHPGPILGFAAAAAGSLAVLLASRSAIELGDTFPELNRVPVLRSVFR
jgi:O-antigen/teichoic acid export membrane protein